jgi:hypothetical protein
VLLSLFYPPKPAKGHKVIQLEMVTIRGRRQENGRKFVEYLVIIVFAFVIGRWSSSQQVMLVEKNEITTRSCTERERSRQAEIFPAAKVRGCSSKDTPVLRIIHLNMPFARSFLDIGSISKGMLELSSMSYGTLSLVSVGKNSKMNMRVR